MLRTDVFIVELFVNKPFEIRFKNTGEAESKIPSGSLAWLNIYGFKSTDFIVNYYLLDGFLNIVTNLDGSYTFTFTFKFAVLGIIDLVWSILGFRIYFFEKL